MRYSTPVCDYVRGEVFIFPKHLSTRVDNRLHLENYFYSPGLNRDDDTSPNIFTEIV